MKKKSSIMLFAGLLLQAAAASTVIAEETIKKDEIIKIFEQLKEQEKDTSSDQNNSIDIPKISAEELVLIERKKAMLKMVNQEISFDAPSVIHIPRSDYSQIKTGNDITVFISSQHVDNLIMQNSQHHENRKKTFNKKRKIENVELNSNSFKTLENEVFEQRGTMGSYQQGFNSQIQTNSSSMNTVITDLIEFTDGIVYKNYAVNISEAFITLTHIEEISNAK